MSSSAEPLGCPILRRNRLLQLRLRYMQLFAGPETVGSYAVLTASCLHSLLVLMIPGKSRT
jgi:hypothetical protein